MENLKNDNDRSTSDKKETVKGYGGGFWKGFWEENRNLIAFLTLMFLSFILIEVYFKFYNPQWSFIIALIYLLMASGVLVKANNSTFSTYSKVELTECRSEVKRMKIFNYIFCICNFIVVFIVLCIIYRCQYLKGFPMDSDSGYSIVNFHMFIVLWVDLLLSFFTYQIIREILDKYNILESVLDIPEYLYKDFNKYKPSSEYSSNISKILGYSNINFCYRNKHIMRVSVLESGEYICEGCMIDFIFNDNYLGVQDYVIKADTYKELIKRFYKLRYEGIGLSSDYDRII